MEMKPIVDGLGEEFEGRVPTFQLNAARGTNLILQADYDLSGHPSFAIIDKKGRIIKRYYGPQSEKVLRDAMKIVADE
jgi:hypothetical protein